MFVLYDVLVNLAVALALLPYELFRIATRRSSQAVLRQRLGTPLAVAPGSVLVHGVSVGELVSAEGLIRELASQRPDLQVVVTAGDAGGRAYGQRLRERHTNIAAVEYLPWDRRPVMRAWLEALAPSVVVIVETEIWPNLYRACGELNIPLAMASARLYPRDVARYGLARSFFVRVLANLKWIGAASDKERDRLVAIGAPAGRVHVTGDLKFTTAALPSARRRGEEPVVVAGCTHPGEEEIVVNACEMLASKVKRMRLVLAPRDIARAAVLRRRFHSTPAIEIEIVDTIGGLAPNYSRADVAFIGGSLVARGGHNPLEALGAGCPVITGPNLDHVETLFVPFERTGAIEIVHDNSELSRAIERFLEMSDGERSELNGLVRRIIQREALGAKAAVEWLLPLVR